MTCRRLARCARATFVVSLGVDRLEVAGLPAPGGIARMGIGVSSHEAVRRTHCVAGVRAARLRLL